MAIFWKNDDDVKICQHDIIVKIFWLYIFFLVNFSWRSKFHVNIVAGSGVMIVSFYNGPVWFFSKRQLSREILPCGCFYSKLILVSGKQVNRVNFQEAYYSKNITYDPEKLPFMHNFQYSRVTKDFIIHNFAKTFKLPKSRGHVLSLNVKNSTKKASCHNISRARVSI